MKWVTRQRIQVNRTATCWLIQRFLDPKAKFLFVPVESVASVQAGTGATGFDAPGATYPHEDAQGLCSFAAWCMNDWLTIRYCWKWPASFRQRI